MPLNYSASECDRIIATFSDQEVLDYVAAGGRLSRTRVDQASRGILARARARAALADEGKERGRRLMAGGAA